MSEGRVFRLGIISRAAATMLLGTAAIASVPAVAAKPGTVMDAGEREISPADYVAIQQLYGKFNLYLNTGQGDRFADLWTEDGEFTGGRPAGNGKDTLPRKPEYVGKQQMKVFAERSGAHGGRHYISNLVVTRTPTGADCTAYVIVMDPAAVKILATGIYQDTLVKTSQGWKFKKKINWRDTDDLTPFKAKPTEAHDAGIPLAPGASFGGSAAQTPAPAGNNGGPHR